jgi:hypothetical protein
MNIFLKAYIIKSMLSLHAQTVVKFLACFLKDINKWKVSACFSFARKQHQNLPTDSVSAIWLNNCFFPVSEA